MLKQRSDIEVLLFTKVPKPRGGQRCSPDLLAQLAGRKMVLHCNCMSILCTVYFYSWSGKIHLNSVFVHLNNYATMVL